eukprot:Nitzschia sp. Nitz4//scaffold102_size76354//57059//58180//NITZ4_005640-RA/size76354-processed-gene-0.45-mRNA-1//-1//CDS//3329532273//662//frame0
MMRYTRPLTAPVVSLLSPAPAASLRAQELLSVMVGLEPQPISKSPDDKLDEATKSMIPGASRRWDSVASVCPKSGTVVHFCSIDGSEKPREKTPPLALLGLTDRPKNGSVEAAIQDFRDKLASEVSTQSGTIMMKQVFGQSVSVASLLRGVSTHGLPILELPASEELPHRPAGLKEVVIPFFDNAAYNDDTTLLGRIGAAQLTRPTVGLYQWPGTLTHIRPLPTAAEDQRLPPPSLVFHLDNMDDIRVHEERGVQVAKIGFGGHRIGQLMLLHPDLLGLDVRVCQQEGYSSAFAEAQESLMAGSLDELQSTYALLEGGGNQVGKEDDRVGNADCWVEVRANLKNPSGFFGREGGMRRGKSTHRIASIPNLPPE